ncbi:MAG: hypothetical protein NVS4B2_14560 [Chloroflexota bacterium]
MEWLLTLATAIGLLGLFVVSEAAGHRGLSTGVTRRLTHVSGGVAAAAFPFYLHLRDVLLLAATFSAFLVVTWGRDGLKSVHAVDRPTLGALVFPLGLALAALVSWPHPRAFVFAALVLALADTAAGAGGHGHGSTVWSVPGGTKSLRGSFFFCVVSCALASALSLTAVNGRPLAVVCAGVLLTVIEGALGYGLDNLAVPPVAAVVSETLLGF